MIVCSLCKSLQQLSQFWYSEETAEMLAKEALAQVGENGRYLGNNDLIFKLVIKQFTSC